jgi:hypothetical protein
VTDLDYIRNIAGRDHGLAVVAVARDDGTVAASVVNAGVLAHPVDGSQVVAFVSGAASRRLERLRAGHSITRDISRRLDVGECRRLRGDRRTGRPAPPARR